MPNAARSLKVHDVLSPDRVSECSKEARAVIINDSIISFYFIHHLHF